MPAYGCIKGCALPGASRAQDDRAQKIHVKGTSLFYVKVAHELLESTARGS